MQTLARSFVDRVHSRLGRILRTGAKYPAVPAADARLLDRYYAGRAVRQRMVDYLGGPSLGRATAMFVQPSDFTGFSRSVKRAPTDLWHCVSEEGDVTVVRFNDRKILDAANIQDLGDRIRELRFSWRSLPEPSPRLRAPTSGARRHAERAATLGNPAPARAQWPRAPLRVEHSTRVWGVWSPRRARQSSSFPARQLFETSTALEASRRHPAG